MLLHFKLPKKRLPGINFNMVQKYILYYKQLKYPGRNSKVIALQITIKFCRGAGLELVEQI